jgi:peptidoglycan/LPS O-acetylase OafA/YrhL
MRRVPELDALRAIAAMVVIGLHAGIVSSAVRFPLLQMWGATAVDLFFVISGYLITTIVLNEGESKGFFLTFYIRRSLRIWPIYYLALAAFAMVNLFLSRPFPTDGLPYYLTYTQNVQYYWFGQAPDFCKAFAHTWSLAVEEQFYLIWPALVWFVGRRGLVPLTVSLMVLAIVARGYWHLDSQLLVTRCDGLALGGLLAALLTRAKPASRFLGEIRVLFGVLGIGSVGYIINSTISHYRYYLDQASLGSVTSPFESSISLFVFNLFFFSVVGFCVCVTGHRGLNILRSRVLVYLGQISYGLYLYHNLIFGLVQRATGARELPLPAVLLALAATLGAAVLSWKYVERPMLALKDRFSYRSSVGLRGEPGRIAEVPQLDPAT